MSDDQTTGTSPASATPTSAASPVRRRRRRRVTDRESRPSGNGGAADSSGHRTGPERTDESSGTDADGAPRKRRRRGSRGGRNRKRPGEGSAVPASAATTPVVTPVPPTEPMTGRRPPGRAPAGTRSPRADGDPGRRPGSRSEDYTDPHADRGLTTDDLAESAAEDAGLRAPRIGDTRPAPAPPAGGGAATGGARQPDRGRRRREAPRRRRRGGRGRSKSRAGEPRPATTVEADLGLGEGVELSRARRGCAPASAGSDPQGTGGRPLPDGRSRRPWDGHADRGARRPRAGRALREPSRRRRHVDRRQHLPRSGAERAARDGGGVHRHRHPEERRALPGRRLLRRGRGRARSSPRSSDSSRTAR